MSVNLKGRSFLTLKDYTAEEIEYLVDLAIDLKAKKKAGIFEKNMEGKNIALIFEKPSTRTRCSFTIGCIDEGAHPEYLSKDDIQLGHKETVEDTARVLAVSYTHLDVYKRQAIQQVIGEIETNGAVNEKNLPSWLKNGCVRLSKLTEETVLCVKEYKTNMAWQNRMNESRNIPVSYTHLSYYGRRLFC